MLHVLQAKRSRVKECEPCHHGLNGTFDPIGLLNRISRAVSSRQTMDAMETGMLQSARQQRICERSSVFAMVLLVVLFVAHPAFCADTTQTGVFGLIVENDVFYHRDGDYTNGIELVWVPADESTAPKWALRAARELPWFPQDGQVRHGYIFGQKMFTPDDITVADPPLDDRPYAGWLYATIGLGVASDRQLDQIWLSLGVVGPASLAGQTQKTVHKWTNADAPQGWDTQLGNEPGIVLGYQRAWHKFATMTALGLDVDLTPDLGASLGNVYTYVDAGITLRYGKSLPLDYGPPRIQPSPPASAFFIPTGPFAWYIYASLEGRAVLRNIFLDGNTFKDSRSVDKEPLVGDLQWGVVLTWRRTRLSYTHVVRTREFKTQGAHEEFGSFSVSISF